MRQINGAVLPSDNSVSPGNVTLPHAQLLPVWESLRGGLAFAAKMCIVPAR